MKQNQILVVQNQRQDAFVQAVGKILEAVGIHGSLAIVTVFQETMLIRRQKMRST